MKHSADVRCVAHLLCVWAAALAVFSAAGIAWGTEVVIGPPPWDVRPNVHSALTELADAYMKAHPGTSVAVAEGIERFDAATVEADGLGDVMFIPAGDYGEASLLGVLASRGLIRPVDDRIAEAAFDKGDYFGNVWETVQIDGRVWGVPMLVRSWGIGVEPARADLSQVRNGFVSWHAALGFLAAAAEDRNNDGHPDATRVATAFSPRKLWEALFLHNGGDPNDPASFHPESGAWQRALDDLARIVSANPYLFGHGRILPASSAQFDAPIQFVHDNASNYGSLPLLRARGRSFELLAAPGSGPIPPLETTVVAIKASTPDQEAAAWDFVAWVTSPDTLGVFCPALSVTPLRKSVAYATPDPDARQFAQQIERMVFQRPVPAESPALGELKEAIHGIVAPGAVH